jgi:hypothetical protein
MPLALCIGGGASHQDSQSGNIRKYVLRSRWPAIFIDFLLMHRLQYLVQLRRSKELRFELHCIFIIMTRRTYLHDVGHDELL